MVSILWDTLLTRMFIVYYLIELRKLKKWQTTWLHYKITPALHIETVKLVKYFMKIIITALYESNDNIFL